MGGHDRTVSLRVVLALLWGLLFSVLGVFQPVLSQAESLADSGIVRLNYRVRESTFDPASEVKLLELLNQVRYEHNVPLLVMDLSLRSAARAHSRDMALQGYFGHNSLGGGSFGDRLAGVARAGAFVGENAVIAQTAEQANKILLASPGHRENMLEPSFHRVGIGIAAAGQLGLMVTEDFSE